MDLTSKLGLQKPESNETFDIEHQNTNMDIIDEAIKDIDEYIVVNKSDIAKLLERYNTETDWIVESGSTSDWLGYRKWHSGIAECWGKFSISTAASASGYVYPVLPFTFSNTNYIVTWGKGNEGTTYVSHNEDIFPEIYAKTTTGFTIKTYNTP